MHSKAKPATRAEKKRMERIVELGCVACRKDHRIASSCGVAEVHHLLDGGVRRGHAFTICLGMWHHRGLPKNPTEEKACAWAEHWYGPSLYHDARAFRERYGSDDELLAYQNELLTKELS